MTSVLHRFRAHRGDHLAEALPMRWVHGIGAGFSGIPQNHGSGARSSPNQLDSQAERGPNMMMAMPARLTATPTQSVVVGLTLSTNISQSSATPT